jgi:hypothetical protein
VRKQYDIMLIAIFAAINITAFAAAGGLSSQISTAVGTEVLIQSLNCGYLDEAYTNPNGHHNSSQAVSFRLLESSREAQSVENAVNYAKQCYSNNTAGMLDCGRFVKKFIASFVDNEASCPVHEKMCRSNSANIRIDSGYINSHRYLGLNSPIEDRILARNVLHCAPITTTGFTSRKNTSLGDLTMYHYGSSLEPSGKKDYMFAAESIESQYAFALSPDDSNNDMVQRIVYVLKLSAESLLH